MATLTVSEFSNLPITSNAIIQAADASSWQTDQSVAIGNTSNPFGGQTAYVVLCSDTACRIAWSPPGASIAATATSALLPANVPVKYGAQPGMRVSTHA
jgi:hypothetical protein